LLQVVFVAHYLNLPSLEGNFSQKLCHQIGVFQITSAPPYTFMGWCLSVVTILFSEVVC